MKRYSESKTQDEMGDMQDGVYESPTGEYIRVDELLAWLQAQWVVTWNEQGEHHPDSPEAAVLAVNMGAYSAVKAHIEG
jgi:hypothetical protein